MIPSVHPMAAITLARAPRERPAASVKSTPVPGEMTTTRDVKMNAVLTTALSLPA
jgi:hypothetical protein